MNVKSILGFAAVAGLLVVATPGERAQALSLSNPGAAAAVQDGLVNNTTEVHWHWHHHHHHWHHHYHHHYWHHRHWRHW